MEQVLSSDDFSAWLLEQNEFMNFMSGVWLEKGHPSKQSHRNLQALVYWAQTSAKMYRNVDKPSC